MEVLPVNAEKELLLKVSQGSEECFRQLFLQYHQQLGEHVYRITNSFDIAEEIIQDVFLKIWVNKEALAEVSNFKAYLFIISRNHTLNCLKKLSRERNYKLKFEDDLVRETISDEDNSDIYYRLIDEAINQLPVQQQKVYLLSRHERLRYNEVADRLNISRETVKKYLQIATLSITTYVQANYKSASFFVFHFVIFLISIPPFLFLLLSLLYSAENLLLHSIFIEPDETNRSSYFLPVQKILL